jgi:hypothetical protein
MICGQDAEKLYDRINDVISDTNIKDPSIKNESRLEDIIEILLVIEPIQDEACFDVNSKINRDLIGLKFDLVSYSIEPYPSFNGNSYNIDILATSDEEDLYYESSFQINKNPPTLRVKKAFVDTLKK